MDPFAKSQKGPKAGEATKPKVALKAEDVPSSRSNLTPAFNAPAGSPGNVATFRYNGFIMVDPRLVKGVEVPAINEVNSTALSYPAGKGFDTTNLGFPHGPLNGGPIMQVEDKFKAVLLAQPGHSQAVSPAGIKFSTEARTPGKKVEFTAMKPFKPSPVTPGVAVAKFPARKQIKFETPANKDAALDTAYPSPPDSNGKSETEPESLRTDLNEYVVLGPFRNNADIQAGGGMNSGIYFVKDIKTGRVYVEKRLRVVKPYTVKRACKEKVALDQIVKAGGSVHVNFMIEGFWDGKCTYASLVLEYCDRGTLQDLIDKHAANKKLYPEAFAWHVFEGMAAALCACHFGVLNPAKDIGKPLVEWDTICHLDIKPCNIFLSSMGKTGRYPRVVLGDFGCVVRNSDCVPGAAAEHNVVHRYGTPGWYPPEVEKAPLGTAATYGKPTDVWQTGGVIQSLCRLLEMPRANLVLLDDPCGSFYSSGLNNLVVCCMTPNIANRPTAIDIYKEVCKQKGR